MTLAELIRKAKEVGDQFNTYEIPLYDGSYDEIFDVEFVADKDEDGYFIKMSVK